MSLCSTCAAVLTAAALAVTGCGGDDKKDSSSSAGATAETFKSLTISTDLAKKPVIPKTEGLPPEKLVLQDVVTGKGKAAAAGGKVQLKYVGTSYSTDQEIDGNWDEGEKLFSGQLAEGPTGVIKGWIQGIPGMKEGGRRLLVIPPELGYGAQGSPPLIPPYETLVFVIDLKKVG